MWGARPANDWFDPLTKARNARTGGENPHCYTRLKQKSRIQKKGKVHEVVMQPDGAMPADVGW
jgi:hypothetical protein